MRENRVWGLAVGTTLACGSYDSGNSDAKSGDEETNVAGTAGNTGTTASTVSTATGSGGASASASSGTNAAAGGTASATTSGGSAATATGGASTTAADGTTSGSSTTGMSDPIELDPVPPYVTQACLDFCKPLEVNCSYGNCDSECASRLDEVPAVCADVAVEYFACLAQSSE